jgi:hypothetical protein
MGNNGEFSKFVTEFGSKDEVTKQGDETADDVDVIDDSKAKARQNATSSGGMMQVGYICSRACDGVDVCITMTPTWHQPEERNTGGEIYHRLLISI